MFKRFSENRYEYSSWDGTQHIDLLDVDAILHTLFNAYLENGNLNQAFADLMKGGIYGGGAFHVIGLREMLARLRDQRNQQLSRYNMGSGVIDDIHKQIDDIRQLEQREIHLYRDKRHPIYTQNLSAKSGLSDPQWQADQQDHFNQCHSGFTSDQPHVTPETFLAQKQEYLNQLSGETVDLIKGLSQYNFINSQAYEKFKALLESLQKQAIQQFFTNRQLSLLFVTPEGVSILSGIVYDLNQMLREYEAERDPNFSLFLQKHGEYFLGLDSFDDLIEQMRRQMAANQGILDNLWPDQKQILQDLMKQLIDEQQPIFITLAELTVNLKAVTTMEDIRTHFPFTGSESLSFSKAMRIMGRLQQMEWLEKQLQQARHLNDLEAIDSEKIRELLGNEEYQSIEWLKGIIHTLREQGYIQSIQTDDAHRLAGGDWKFTDHGIHKIGQNALKEIFSKLKKDGLGQHIMPNRGTGGERDDVSKPYHFGDSFALHLEKTLINALRRNPKIGKSIQLAKDDFEVYHTELTTQSSTVLMIDMSLSMVYNGCHPAAKKVAVALEYLMRSQFPRDHLYIVGFSFIAREYKPYELIELSRFDYDRGTNMAHGLMLARQLLAKHRGVNKQIIMITDGSPTVWYEERLGGWQFQFPSPLAEEYTLREVQRCTRDGITINTFMLYDDEYMAAFVNQIAEINHGRLFSTSKDNLGEYLLLDYLNSKHNFLR